MQGASKPKGATFRLLNSRRAWLSLRKLWLHLHSVMESQHWKKAARLRSSSETRDSGDSGGNTATEMTGERCKELRNLRTPLWDRLNSGTAWIREEGCDCTSHPAIKSQSGKQETRLKELLLMSQDEESYRSPVGTKENCSLTICCPCRKLVGVKVVRSEWDQQERVSQSSIDPQIEVGPLLDLYNPVYSSPWDMAWYR